MPLPLPSVISLVEMVRLPTPDPLAHRVVREQHLADAAAPPPVGDREQNLGDDRLERERQLRANLT